MTIVDVIRESKFRWLGHVIKREPPSMPVVHYKVKGTITRIYNEWSVVSNKVEMWIDKW